MTKKKPKPNPIEEAIGGRTKKLLNPKPIPQPPQQIADEPSQSEMLSLEELNRRTEARLQEKWPEKTIQTTIPTSVEEMRTIPASGQDPQPVTKTSSPESPEGGIKSENIKNSPITDVPPIEDIELVALREYIQEDGFVLSTVAFHIVTLCAQPMVTPSTTTWDFAERAEIPAMVLALLNQEGYLEGIWPSLKIVMGSNKGNAAWCSGIATTFAFFDTIRMLPVLEELKNGS